MPYCTRCGKKIEEGERCSCQSERLPTDFNKLAEEALSNKNPVRQFFGVKEMSVDPKVRYERGMKIIPENVMPDEGEITLRQYDLCTMRSRIKFARAEGRLQVTNKRIIFRAKGTSLSGPTQVQHEFSIAELAGFQISRNFRFSLLDMLLIVLLSAGFVMLGRNMATGAVDSEAHTFLLILYYLLGLVLTAATFFLGDRYAGKVCISGFASMLLFGGALQVDSRTIGMILLIPALLALIQLVASVLLFSFKPNLDFNVCTKMGNGVLHIRCEKGGFARLTPRINAVFTGYNEVLPTEETDVAIREIGAMVSDIQKIGDLAIEKWKKD